MFEPVDSAGFYYVVWRREGAVWARSNGAPQDIEIPARPAAGAVSWGERTRGLLREVFTFTPPGECLLVGRSTAPEEAALREYGRWLAAISGGVLLLGLAIGWWIATRAIRPIGVITATARRIAKGELGERIPVRETESELGGLSSTLNETFAQLEESFERQARFTADAAHELRTPVAIILAQAQRALTRERDPVSYQQTLEACVNAARRLNQLTESLLELSTHDAGALVVKPAASDLAEIARETASLIQPIADDRRITLACELNGASCRADASRIAQVILNLLTNALDHTLAEGRVTLRTGIEAGHAFFAVTDTGPGIAAEHLPRIFDRFYRADDSRNRRSGGAGLGLAICKGIAEAHGGSLEVRSAVGKGSTFTLRIPV
jgi:heavy metal sensor kinase